MKTGRFLRMLAVLLPLGLMAVACTVESKDDDDCQASCGELPDACKSCIVSNSCENIESACASACSGGSSSSSSSSTSSGGNCSPELAGCDFDSDCCSNNCYNNSCECTVFGCGCDFDSDCDSNNCFENSCE